MTPPARVLCPVGAWTPRFYLVKPGALLTSVDHPSDGLLPLTCEDGNTRAVLCNGLGSDLPENAILQLEVTSERLSLPDDAPWVEEPFQRAPGYLWGNLTLVRLTPTTEALPVACLAEQWEPGTWIVRALNPSLGLLPVLCIDGQVRALVYDEECPAYPRGTNLWVEIAEDSQDGIRVGTARVVPAGKE